MPLIDSLMRELNATGFISNRGRQLAASYLARDLKQDWRYGAYYFEEKLIDHDVHSNYGGWNYAVCIGPGHLDNFDQLKASKHFDKDGKYIKKWCPELKEVSEYYIHEPWHMPQELQRVVGVRIGIDYPNVILFSSSLVQLRDATRPRSLQSLFATESC